MGRNAPNCGARVTGWVVCGVVWYMVVWWYGMVVWCGLVWFSVVWWFGVVWKIAVCLNRPPTRAPEIPYGAIGTKLRCACGGMGVGWWGVVFWGMVVWYGMVWCGMVWFGVLWCGMVWFSVAWCGLLWCGNRALPESAAHHERSGNLVWGDRHGIAVRV